MLMRILQWLGLALAVGVLAGLGSWQVKRGLEKQALVADYARALFAAPDPLEKSTAVPPDALMKPVLARGRYVADRQLLMDNQVHAERAGYDVWTPLRLSSGGLVMIDRGWIAGSTHHEEIAAQLAASPPPSGEVELRGLLRALPEPALRLKTEPCAGKDWPRVVEYPQLADLRCLMDDEPIDGVVLLDAAATGGFIRDWKPAQGFPPERHFGYAVQWYALALTLLVLSIFAMRKKPG
jgi:surfeit locus 1 family protein